MKPLPRDILIPWVPFDELWPDSSEPTPLAIATGNRKVLTVAHADNPEVKHAGKVATVSLKQIRQLMHERGFGEGELDEFVSVAVMAAVVGGGKTAKQAIDDYLSGKYPDDTTKYVFGIALQDTLSKKVSGVIEAEYEHDGHRHTRGGHLTDKGNVQPNERHWRDELADNGITSDSVYRWEDRRGRKHVTPVIELMRPYDPPSRLCDNLADSREARKAVWALIRVLLDRVLKGFAKSDPDGVKAFRAQYLGKQWLDNGERAAEIGISRQLMAYRAEKIVERLRFHALADYICPTTAVYDLRCEKWRLRQAGKSTYGLQPDPTIRHADDFGNYGHPMPLPKPPADLPLTSDTDGGYFGWKGREYGWIAPTVKMPRRRTTPLPSPTRERREAVESTLPVGAAGGPEGQCGPTDTRETDNADYWHMR
jgi:hypothetical protein